MKEENNPEDPLSSENKRASSTEEFIAEKIKVTRKLVRDYQMLCKKRKKSIRKEGTGRRKKANKRGKLGEKELEFRGEELKKGSLEITSEQEIRGHWGKNSPVTSNSKIQG